MTARKIALTISCVLALALGPIALAETIATALIDADNYKLIQQHMTSVGGYSHKRIKVLGGEYQELKKKITEARKNGPLPAELHQQRQKIAGVFLHYLAQHPDLVQQLDLSDQQKKMLDKQIQP